ncbi:uncharacterized protein LOC119674277 [Teleopsis dalmanni]|uniref:uncharacterized protein LOC119672109 n=1 Tax=Teleopsis dalmanni TaxID=139649 RepID=UPI0018CEEE54|nr:uncharacterized protein LOC119672109 [Teleopsis dalmanni]XP_037941340.1 uncharacterized protein LOC119674277 [Teleopsis dalmanni]
MTKLKILILLTACILCSVEAIYPPSQRQVQLVEITLPNVIEDFEYVPTQGGYRYSYKVFGGPKREEYGVIPNAEAATGVRGSGRDQGKTKSKPRYGTKNRKLSPKSLQSLAG